MGGARVIENLLPVMRELGLVTIFEDVNFGRIGTLFDEHGNLLDDESIRLLGARDAYLVPTLVTYWALKQEGMNHGLPRGSWDKVDAVLGEGLGKQAKVLTDRQVKLALAAVSQRR